MSLTAQEADELSRLMAKVTWPAPEKVFFAWQRHCYTNGIELAFLKIRQPTNLILLTQRPADDPYYPSMWHMPGSIQQPGETFLAVLKRCAQAEVGAQSSDLTKDATLLTLWNDLDKVRGHVNQFLYARVLQEKEEYLCARQEFFPLNDLPKPMIHSHVTMIEYIRGLNLNNLKPLK